MQLYEIWPELWDFCGSQVGQQVEHSSLDWWQSACISSKERGLWRLAKVRLSRSSCDRQVLLGGWVLTSNNTFGFIFCVRILG